MEQIGTRLAAARAAKGLTLEAVARQTRIAEEHLLAIEEGRDLDLPAGPYRRAWIRAYCDAMGIEEPDITVEPMPQPAVPLGVVRGVGLLMVFVLVLIIALLQWGPDRSVDTSEPEPAITDQHVTLEARRSIRVVVTIDGERRFDDVIAGGTKQTFDAHDRIEISVPAVEAVTIRYNGQSIVPQGRQDVPRTLLFIDDGGR